MDRLLIMIITEISILVFIACVLYYFISIRPQIKALREDMKRMKEQLRLMKIVEIERMKKEANKKAT